MKTMHYLLAGSLLLSTPCYPQEQETIGNLVGSAFAFVVAASCYCCAFSSFYFAKKRKGLAHDLQQMYAPSEADVSVKQINVNSAENECAHTIKDGCRLSGCCGCLIGTLAFAVCIYQVSLGIAQITS